MKKRIQQRIASFLLVLLFLLPSFSRLEHQQHEYFKCNAKNEKHFHVQHEKCSICSYEFSTFSFNHQQLEAKKINFISFVKSIIDFSPFGSLSKCTFLLRAPPVIL